MNSKSKIMAQESEKNQKQNVQAENGLEEIKEIYNFMCDESLDELEISRKDFSIRMVRNSSKIYQYNPPNQNFAVERTETQKNEARQTEETAPAGELIKAPLTGTFYRSPSPKSSAFVNEGDKVQAGTTLCILEAMKVMNEIKADKPCEIVKIVAENGKVVKAGDTIFIIKS